MGYLKYFSEMWKNQDNKALVRERMIEWRASDAVTKVENPMKLDRARALGYKAKQGIFIARVRLLRGGRQRPIIKKGRKTKNRRRMKIVEKSYQVIAEERANKRFPNCEVIGSYELGKDGKHYFYEVILADRVQGSKYPELRYLAYSRGRVYRGKTSAGKKSRGLTGKGIGYENLRPRNTR